MGNPGPAVVTLNLPENAGTNCANGGVQLQFGPDIDGDLQLDPGEVNTMLTKYLCNGAPGTACHDLNANSQCDTASEDLNLDGLCNVTDCNAASPTQFIRDDTAVQTANFNVSGSGASGSFATHSLSVTPPPGSTTMATLVRVSASPTGTPLDLFKVDASGGLVASGSSTSGVIPASGPGSRLMWYPRKSAFRAGFLQGPGPDTTGTEWDDANVGYYSTSFGEDSIASGGGSFAVGSLNRASGSFSTAMGERSVASAPFAVAIGNRVSASGGSSMALGQFASAENQGSFVWSDGSAITPVTSTANYQFTIRAAGGVRLFTNDTSTSGVSLSPGGSSWNVVSDRNAKTDFRDLDGEEVLSRLAALPIPTWTYKAEQAHPRHVGPMAQDFHAAFGFGTSDVTINTLDLDGINLAASKALERRTSELAEKTRRIESLEVEVQSLKASLRRIEQRLEKR